MRLFQRKNGFFYVETNRNKRKSLKTNDKSIAVRMFRQLEKAALSGKLIQLEGKRVLLEDFISEYINERNGKKSDNTIRIDRDAFKKLISFTGNIPISYLSPMRMEQFVSHLIKSGLDAVTVNITIRTLKAAFNKAVKWEIIDKSPFRNIQELPIKNNLPKALTIEQVKKLISVLDDQEFKEYVFTCLYTGGRRTEAAKLQWQDFSCVDGQNWIITLKTTKDENKNIPLADNLKEVLFYRKKDIGPVFPYYYHNYREASKHFRKYADMAGIPNKLHDLRHTCATFMLINKVPLAKIRDILGHTSIRTTEIYAKLVVEELRDGINTLKS